MTDEQIREAFIALCERTGAAEKVRREVNPTNPYRLIVRGTLRLLDLTALLTPPEPCATCGGTGRLVTSNGIHREPGIPGYGTWELSEPCPTCGGAS